MPKIDRYEFVWDRFMGGWEEKSGSAFNGEYLRSNDVEDLLNQIKSLILDEGEDTQERLKEIVRMIDETGLLEGYK